MPRSVRADFSLSSRQFSEILTTVAALARFGEQLYEHVVVIDHADADERDPADLLFTALAVRHLAKAALAELDGISMQTAVG